MTGISLLLAPRSLGKSAMSVCVCVSDTVLLGWVPVVTPPSLLKRRSFITGLRVGENGNSERELTI